MTEIQQAFYELMFGYGRFFGLFFFMIITLLASYKLKFYGIVLVLPIFLLGYEYSINIASTSDFMWSVVLLFVTGLFVMFNAVQDIYD